MSETRKSDFLGDVFGDWTVIARAESGGDRKRRWTVENETTGVKMDVLQTNLRDLALTKEIQTKNAGVDSDRAARAIVAANHAETQGAFGNVFTLTEAEADLYRRLDNSIEAAQLVTGGLIREAQASVALDNDPECGTYTFAAAELNPFDDSDCPECGDEAEFTQTLVAAMMDPINGESGLGGNLPSPVASFPSDMLGEIARVEAELTTALQDATGDDTLSVVYATTPLLTENPWVNPGDQDLREAIDLILKAKVNLNSAIKNLEDLLNG